MRFVPSAKWQWYIGRDLILELHLCSESGERFVFKTRFSVHSLRYRPYSEAFSENQCRLLYAGMHSLSSVKGLNLRQADCFDLCINAAACASFLKIPGGISRFFMAGAPALSLSLGTLASLYAKNGSICDVLCLSDQAESGTYRMMLLNPKAELGIHGAHILRLGAMIIVHHSCIFPLRSFSGYLQQKVS